jgi:predicted transcriptional regulator
MKTETIEKNRPSINMTVKLEEAQQRFIAAAKQSLADYRATGEHITLDEMETWTDELKNNPKAPLPLCHK